MNETPREIYYRRPIQNPKGECMIRHRFGRSTWTRCPWSRNHDGTDPRERESADRLCRPGIWRGESFKQCDRLKYSIAASNLNPRLEEQRLLRNQATTSVLSVLIVTSMFGLWRENAANAITTPRSSRYAMGKLFVLLPGRISPYVELNNVYKFLRSVWGYRK